MSVLVIDSDPTAKISLLRMFGEQGIKNVHIIETAKATYEFLHERNNDKGAENINLIIISDNIIDADSFSLCRKLKEEKSVSSAYIMLVVSSIENKSAIAKAKQCGANNYAIKPYHESVFLTQLLDFMQQRVVLLIEDDAVVQQLVSRIISKQELEVISVDDGILARNLINSMLPPRFVVMDIGLPSMNGLQLIVHIRKKNAWRQCPILMLTASTDANDVREALSNGANDYIAKPFEVTNFMQRISKYISKSESV